MCYIFEIMRTIEKQLKQCLVKIEYINTNDGFKIFQVENTMCTFFCQLKELHSDPVLDLYGSKFHFVKKQNFQKQFLIENFLLYHTQNTFLQKKKLRALNLLKLLSHTNWGADRTTLLQLQLSLIRSKLHYGTTVYHSPRKLYVYLQMLESVEQSTSLSISSPFRLYVGADEPALSFRRERFSLLLDF